jgi:hypothetical protein
MGNGRNRGYAQLLDTTALPIWHAVRKLITDFSLDIGKRNWLDVYPASFHLYTA